jgi:hypothetical protein
MNGVWILMGLGVLAVVAAVFGWLQGRAQPADLGVVSHQWIAEHRLSQTQDSQR